MSDLRNGVSSVSEDFECNRCGELVYWGPHYGSNGDLTRKLFTRATHRVHDCRVQPNADDFEVIE
jgi:hypothetical protein